jgi:hypothetical protein
MSEPLNKSKGGSLLWAWRILDRHRRRDTLTPHQIEMALSAIKSAHGRHPIHGSPTYAFDDEVALRAKHSPR